MHVLGGARQMGEQKQDRLDEVQAVRTCLFKYSSPHPPALRRAAGPTPRESSAAAAWGGEGAAWEAQAPCLPAAGQCRKMDCRCLGAAPAVVAPVVGPAAAAAVVPVAGPAVHPATTAAPAAAALGYTAVVSAPLLGAAGADAAG